MWRIYPLWPPGVTVTLRSLRGSSAAVANIEPPGSTQHALLLFQHVDAGGGVHELAGFDRRFPEVAPPPPQ